MQLISNTTDFRLMSETAVGIGKFDGFHLGHKKLLEEILKAGKKGLTSVVFTFDPLPEVLFGRRSGQLLTTREEKRKLFESMGVDILIEYPMNRETASMEAEVFVREILVSRLRLSLLTAGADLSFGRGGRGNAEMLAKMAEEFDFRLNLIEKVRHGDREISSTYIRQEVAQGHMECVEELLGEPYQLMGEVVHGAKLGRRIGMPTINLVPETDKLLPPLGVYFSRTVIGGRGYRSITNIGRKPTVASELAVGAESYLYEFDKDVYGSAATVQLLHFWRPEKRFDSLEELKNQMMKDVEAGRRYVPL